MFEFHVCLACLISSTSTSITGCLPENNCEESWHKRIKAAIAMYLRGSTTVCLKKAIPRMSKLDGKKMPAELTMTLQVVKTDSLKKAKLVADKSAGNMIYTDKEGEYFVLRRNVQEKCITKSMVKKYRQMLEGESPDLQVTYMKYTCM